MRNKLMLLLVLIALFVAFVLIRFFVFDRQSVTGELKIVASPGASVFINNAIIGKTPFREKYKTGEYLLKLIPEGAATETASWNGKITIYKNAMTYVNRELGSSDITSAGEIFTTQKMSTPPKDKSYGEIYVETEPQGAIVTLDNDEKGIAPLILENVMRGDHEISVFMPGFFRRTQKINVDPGYRVNAAFKLAIDQSQASINAVAKKEATESAKPGVAYVTIDDNPQGWLRVRLDGSVDASEAAKVKPGEKYELMDEKSGWYKIKYNNNEEGLFEGEFIDGWVSSEYSTKVDN